MKDVAAVILAAGKGKRMKSKLRNKVVLTLAERPMIGYTVENLEKAKISIIVVVVGFQKDSVQEVLKTRVSYVYQRQRLGTAHALQQAVPLLPKKIKYVISMYGDDSAFYPPTLFRQLYKTHLKSGAAVTVVTVEKREPAGLGRIVRDREGRIVAIIEEKNATNSQRKITEINTGLYCFSRDFLETGIGRIKKNPVANEYYLTDIVEVAVRAGEKVEGLSWSDASIWWGVNTPDQLVVADRKMRQRRGYAHF
ncbi:hypothetical protein A3A66_01185 [Microgenomates group bacterium RIFCSPLOWO2_01_FULL_46_13]|nr:MAG: hypothetical protein A2783_01070 [Microgenomates group bacterium RIFCSPHIGHO2_01_FULL_45_11]OGV94618.1 MAG: hypothetical protein A3A66_01185 [Microgenomates group bacterium RIFCSPLOWO2_01_FULL_46_13]